MPLAEIEEGAPQVDWTPRKDRISIDAELNPPKASQGSLANEVCDGSAAD